MAHRAFVAVLLLAIGCAHNARREPAVDSVGGEQAIRAVEEQERLAVLHRDFAALERIWSDDFIVNTPRSDVSPNRKAVLELFRRGVANYRTFERRIEVIRVSDDHAVVMGSETVQPAGDAVADRAVERRFTNVWRREDGTWRLWVRHANVLPPARH
ncbi:MAG TPA: nuclear transport factor 2 family protein [Anaeromyxobacteraceae bacterium]|nr:nuclear transport factor 2 family protein [Anaeromyxobacteraceae bacterium]